MAERAASDGAGFRPARASSRGTDRNGTAQRVIIADDHADTRIILRHYLEAYGLRVIEAADGVEALAEMRAAGTDALILDLQMPEMDGLHVLERLKADWRLARIPVIVLTGDSTAIEEARRAGADECLTKPAHPRALYEAVASLLIDRSP